MLKQADFDVPDLEEADFEIMDTNSKVFLTDVRIAHIMGEVASKVSNPCSTPFDQAYILNLLSDWVSQLAPDLSLYTCDGSRAKYRFAISEIHLEYLATLIISQALYRHLDKRWPCSAACLVASTCMAKSYEEILCREDVANISNLHAFLCLTAAVPLLYYKPVTPEKEKQRRDDLSVLHSVIDLQSLDMDSPKPSPASWTISKTHAEIIFSSRRLILGRTPYLSARPEVRTMRLS